MVLVLVLVLVLVPVPVPVQEATLKDSRLIRDALHPESADNHHHMGQPHPAMQCVHRSNQQLKDNSEDSKQINYLRCVTSGIPPNLSVNMSRIVLLFFFMVFFVVKLFLEPFFYLKVTMF